MRPTVRISGAPSLRGFTLLEAIATAAVVAVLLSFLLPALSSARRSAHQAVDLSNLRQHASVFAAYNAEFRDYFPYFTRPEGPTRVRCGSFWVRLNYFEAYCSWNIGLADWYYEGRYEHESFIPPGYRENVLGVYGENYLLFTPYWWSDVFLADPAYWTYDGRRRPGPQLWRATRAPEVSSPSAKGLLMQHWPFFSIVRQWPHSNSTPTLPIAFADGSARPTPPNRVLPGHREGTGVLAGIALPVDMPTMATIDGVRGRDVN